MRMIMGLAGGVLGVLLCFVLLYGFHLWAARPLDFQKLVYPFRSVLSQLHIDCDGFFEMSSVLRFTVRELKIPSGQIAMIHDGKLSRCVVSKDGRWVGGRSVSHDTRFRYASLTKPALASAIYHLAVTSPLELRDPLLKHLSLGASRLSDPRIKSIRIEHLLSHQSGLDEEKRGHGMFSHGKKAWCPGSWQDIAKKNLKYEPGFHTTYANANYCLLAVVVQRLTGKSWFQLLDEHFEISSYGIKVIPSEGYLPDEVSYDFMNSGFYTEDYYLYNDLESGASTLGLSGSATGLAEWFSREVLTNTAVSEGLLKWDPSPSCDLSSVKCYMSGFAGYQSVVGKRYFVHTGKLYGASSLIVVSDQNDVLVWLGNGNLPGGGAEKLVKKVVAIMEHSE